MDLDAYRAAAQAFATVLNRAHHRRFAGLDGRWDPEELYARHAALFDDRAIEALREEAARNPDPPARQTPRVAQHEGSDRSCRVRRLLRFAVETRLGAVTARADAARAAAEAEEDVAGITARLAAEDDLVVRIALEEQRLDVVTRRLTAPAAEALERVRAEARALGWPSARALLGEVRGADLGALGAEAEALLRATAPPSLGADVVARHDLPRAVRAAWADPALPADPIAHLRGALARRGLPERFTLDAAPRPGKSPRAFCAAIAVPGDVHLVVAPRGGLPDLQALFHEAGHAVHLTHRDPAAPFEARHLVDRADTEALAFAFEDLALEGVGDERVHGHAAAVGALRARHLAASLLHGIDLLDEGPHPALRERYARRMAAATGLTWPSAPWLAGADPLLGSADYLRALGRARALNGDTLVAALTSTRA
jgi:hypothetical protein